MTERILSAGQEQALKFLKENFGLSESELDRVLFLNDRVGEEPWIPADIMEAIARQVGSFQHISVIHDKFVAERQQVLYTATVVDNFGRTFTRSGAALVDEKPNGQDIDVEILAQTRALNAALNAAGFNPFKAGSVVNLNFQRKPITDDEKRLVEIQDEAELRNKDLRQIHALAEEKGLIVNKDLTRYRQELQAAFGVQTAAVLDHAERVAVINWLTNFQDFLSGLPADIQQDAMIA